MRQAIEELRASKAMTRVLREGHEAPPFALLDTRGERVRLEDLLEQSRAVVLNFFRGHW